MPSIVSPMHLWYACKNRNRMFDIHTFKLNQASFWRTGLFARCFWNDGNKSNVERLTISPCSYKEVHVLCMSKLKMQLGMFATVGVQTTQIQYSLERYTKLLPPGQSPVDRPDITAEIADGYHGKKWIVAVCALLDVLSRMAKERIVTRTDTNLAQWQNHFKWIQRCNWRWHTRRKIWYMDLEVHRI